MPSSNRLLFVAGALSPFTKQSPLATLTRSLPEQVQDASDFEIRIMMPCYGDINERKHNLHEVIRLSDTDVPMGTETKSVAVKVASVPDAQLQVYFMDHDGYFEGADAPPVQNGNAVNDPLDQALFFNRSVLETIRELRWGPDLIHSFGWISSFTPSLLATTFADDDLLGSTKSVFTPDANNPEIPVHSAFAERMGLSLDGTTGSTLAEVGHTYADATIFPPKGSTEEGTPAFSDETAPRTEQAVSLYDQMLSEVPA
jgi:starch synthase